MDAHEPRGTSQGHDRSPEAPRIRASAEDPPLACLLALQRGAGNRAVSRLIATARDPSTERQAPLDETVRTRMESLSGVPLGDVRVRYDSSEPARIGALAHARGAEIHLAPGQESQLAHEAWHVVQQRQGRVSPTGQLGGLGFNGDAALESEADAMATRAAGAVPQRARRGIAVPARSEHAGVLQARLDPLASTADVQAATVAVTDEIRRQKSELESKQPKQPKKPTAAMKRVSDAELTIAKNNANTDRGLAIDRLNKAIEFLNKNEDEGLVSAKAVPKPVDPARALTIQQAMADPDYQVAKDLGVFDHPELRNWLSESYLSAREAKGTPELPLNVRGIITELEATDAIAARHEAAYIEGEVEILRNVKVIDPNKAGRHAGDVKEIDQLVVSVTDDGEGGEILTVMELIEAKSDIEEKGLALSVPSKLAALRNARAKGHRVIAELHGDITDRLLVPTNEVKGLKAGPGAKGPHYGLRGLADRLYKYLNDFRYALSPVFGAEQRAESEDDSGSESD